MKKLTFLFGFLFLGIIARSQFTELLDFNASNGLNPYGNLTPSITKDTLFGMTLLGGAYYAGNIFSIQPDGTGYTDLLDFNGTNGANPFGSLTLSKSGKELYGLTSDGGNSSFGDIFKINTDGSGFADIFDFSYFNGAYPSGSLVASVTGDTLFGMGTYGGFYDYGNVFSICKNGTGFYDIFDFNNSDGAEPFGSVTLAHTGKSLFGMTNTGTSSYGDIFVVNTDGSGFAVLLNFNGTNGANPYGDLLLAGDTLLGMTSEGGEDSYGTVFSIISGYGYTDLLDFNGTNGEYPNGDLTLKGGILYGMASQGGAASNGTFFSINTDGTGYVDLFDFTGDNGSEPYGSLVLQNNILYGMTEQGGEFSYGTIFSDSLLVTGAMTIQNVTCTSGDVGQARVLTSGGITPYTYYWSPRGNTTAFVSGLSLGSYTITVTDNRGSTATAVAVISGVSVTAAVQHEVNCYGGNGGAAIAEITGGTPPFSYSWSDGGTNSLKGDLSAGIYTITVTDVCGATASAPATITQPFALEESLVSITYPSDSGAPGSATISVQYGTPPYTYSWSPNTSTTFTATDLSAGTYSVAVADYNGCTSIFNVSTTNISFPIQPRWAKRGMYVYLVDNLYNPTIYGVDFLNANPGFAGELASYCHTNNITYVVVFELMEDEISGVTSTGWVFGNHGSNVGVVQNESALGGMDGLITTLKAAGVEEVGIGYQWPSSDTYQNGYPPYSSTDPPSFQSVEVYNENLPITQKVDVISLDEEWWNDGWDFTDYHLPLIESMHSAVQDCNCYCNGPSLRAEDYFCYQQSATTYFEMLDEAEYCDRILFAEYVTTVLTTSVNYDPYLGIYDGTIGNWPPFFQTIGAPSIYNPFEKEVWGTFSAENADWGSHTCVDKTGADDDFSGYDLWSTGNETHSEYIENLFYQNLNMYYNSEYSSTTNKFQILGSMWFEYYCMSLEPIGFSDPISAYLPFYVTVGHDLYTTGSALPVTANVSELSPDPPYTYTWYDMNTGNILSTVTTSSTSNTYTLPYNSSNNSYPTSKLGVVVQDNAASPNTLTATDYLCIYGQYQGSISALNPISASNGICLCSGGSTTLTETPVIPGFTYSWSPSTFLNTTTGTSVTATNPTVTTTYTVTASDTYNNDACGLSLSNTVSVYVDPGTPAINLAGSDDDFCTLARTSVMLMAISPCATSFNWKITDETNTGDFTLAYSTTTTPYNFVTVNVNGANVDIEVQGVNDCGTTDWGGSFGLSSVPTEDCGGDSPVKLDSSSGNKTISLGNQSNEMQRNLPTSQDTQSQKISANDCTVYPNPANEILNIEISGEATNQIENYFYLYDNLGQVVKQELLTNSVTTVPILNLASGIYFYRIVNQEQELIKSDKLVLIH